MSQAIQTLLYNGRQLLGSDPENTPLARMAVTAFLALNMLYTNNIHPVARWFWIVLGVAYGAWVVFALCAGRFPRIAVPALIACVIISAVPTAWWPDAAPLTTPIIMTGVVLAFFANQRAIGTRLIFSTFVVALVVVAVGNLDLDRIARHMLTQGALLTVMLMVGLYRRQNRIQVSQSKLLLEQTRLTQQEQARAAALGERGRIAREMHDVLAHSLGALTVQLDVAEGLLSEKGDVPSALTHVRRSQRLAQDGLTEARGAVAALRDDVPPLPEAVSALVEGYRRDHRMVVNLVVDGEPRAVRSAAAVSLLRTAREALTNAGRHAPGTSVTVALTFDRERVRLSVRNPLSSTSSARTERAPGIGGGYGLTGMRERIALVGGSLSAEPGPGGSDWHVTAEVPE